MRVSIILIKSRFDCAWGSPQQKTTLYIKVTYQDGATVEFTASSAEFDLQLYFVSFFALQHLSKEDAFVERPRSPKSLHATSSLSNGVPDIWATHVVSAEVVNWALGKHGHLATC